MKQVRMHEFGAPEVLSLVEQESLAPHPNQVVIKVACAALNPVDYKTRNGVGFVAEKVRTRLPWTPGYDLSGTIIAKGSHVLGWEVGQRVCGMVNFPLPAGAYSEEVIVSPDVIAAIPEGVSDQIAAALPLAGLTAWQGLKEVGHICSGQNVLVLAAAGGVGHIATQLAMNCGAQVWGTASPENQAFLENLGVRWVDYHRVDSMNNLPEMDLVFDAVGGSTGEMALTHLREGGVLVTLPTISAESIARAAQQQAKTALGFTVYPDPKQLQYLLQHVADKQLKIEISEVFQLENIVDAHHLLQNGHVRGKIIIQFE